MNALTDLLALQSVVQAAFSAAEARMGALRVQEMAILEQLEALQVAERDRARSRDVADTALRAGADLKWEHWISQRRQHLNTHWAQLRVQMERERAVLALAFGRKTVLEDMLCAEKQAVKFGIERRLRREG